MLSQLFQKSSAASKLNHLSIKREKRGEGGLSSNHLRAQSSGNSVTQIPNSPRRQQLLSLEP